MNDKFRSSNSNNYVASSDTQVEALLSRLEKVKAVGRDRWQARCPAHDDKSPSLSISLADDGKVLIRCFAGCETGDVLQAIGLSWRDVFPPQSQAERERFRAAARAKQRNKDKLTLHIAKSAVERGEVLTANDKAYLNDALKRLYGGASDE